MRGHQARQRGTPPATTTARGQVPSHNGHRVPQTREARTPHDEPRLGGGCQGQPGPHVRTPHPRPVGSGPRPHGRNDGWSGVGECPTLDAPHPGRRRPPRAPSCRPHSAQSRLARARAVALVTGASARTPRHPQPVGSGPRPQPERTSGCGGVGVGRAPDPGRPTPGKKRPPRAPSFRPHRTQERALWGW